MTWAKGDLQGGSRNGPTFIPRPRAISVSNPDAVHYQLEERRSWVPAAGLIPGFNSPEDESLIFSSDVSLIFVVVFSMESS
jgi:hypothetical protein